MLFKAGLLNVSPFTGGGESSFEQVRGWWIGRHFIESLTSITGLSTGVDEVSQYWGLNSVLFAVVAITIVVVVISLNLVMQLKGYFSKSRSSEQNIARRDLLLLFFLFSGTTLSASLVIERIEFRWLYGPFIFFILITAQLTRQFRLPSSGYFAVIPILSLLLLIDASYVPNHDDSRSQSNQVATALRALKSQAPPDGPWKLIVNTTNWQPWSQWQYGYGYVFSTLPNPPQEPVLIVNNLGKRALVDVCNQGWRPDQCVILGADGLKDQPTVSVLTVDRE